MKKKNTTEEVLAIAPGKVHVSEHNTRQPGLKDVQASGLLESMRTQGQLTPGLGRPHPSKKGEIELAAGACRLTACIELGVSFRVIVREMTDEELIDAILTENLQRTDPDPEAEATLIERRLAEGLAPGEIAARYGKSEMWVKRRIKILKIDPSVRKLFSQGESLAHYNTEMKERIGDLPVADQKLFAQDWDARRVLTLKGLCETINRNSNSLEGQDWINDPATAIDGCGPGCSTDTSQGLFHDPKAKCGTCMNGSCFNKRRLLAIDLAMDAALGDSKLADVVVFSTENTHDFTYRSKTVKVMYHWDFKDNYKVSRKATELVGINMKSALKPVRVFLERLAAVDGKKPAPVGGNNTPKVSREDGLTGKRLAAMNERVKEALAAAPLPTTVPLLQLVGIFGTNSNNSHCMSSGDAKAWDLVTAGKLPPLSVVDRAAKDTVENTIWHSVRKVIGQRLFFHR
ncbi:MAG: ParB/RepB/Spo0J family partition protein, partial [Verrucomicrobiota bacterium]